MSPVTGFWLPYAQIIALEVIVIYDKDYWNVYLDIVYYIYTQYILFHLKTPGVMRGALIQDISQKKDPFNRSLTVNYWISKGFSLVEYPFKRLYKKTVESLIYQVDNMVHVLYDFYEEADKIDEQTAKKVLPKVKELRKSILKQREKFSSIDYTHSREARKKFNLLVKIANRLEARIHARAYKSADPIPTPNYLIEKMRDNSKKAVVNGLS